MVGNAYNGVGAVVWCRVASKWTRIELEPGTGSSAKDINAAGTIIAGVRWLPLARDPTTKYDEHVVWVEQGPGVWQVFTLKGADPSLDEGKALGIADQDNGSTVVVGYSWQDSAGQGGTVWAVAWTLAKDAAEFGSPRLLPPLSRKWLRGSTRVGQGF